MDLKKDEEVKPIQSVKMNINQSNTYKRDLDWVQFADETKVQEKHQV